MEKAEISIKTMINSGGILLEALENMGSYILGGGRRERCSEKHGVLLGPAHRRSFLLLAFSNFPVLPIF